jgi:iron(III) transport system substrate-binding protein
MPLALPPVIALPTGIGVAKHAPHPFAAALFWEHFLTEGQKILASQDNVPSNRKVKEPPPGLVFVDSARLLDEGDQWTRLFRSIFMNQSR